MLQNLIHAFRFAAKREASDPDFEAELAQLVRLGLFIAGILGFFGTIANLLGWYSAGLKLTFWYNLVDTANYVALPDKILIVVLCALSIYLSRVLTHPQKGRFLMGFMVLTICFFSMLDDLIRGDLSGTSEWLVLFLIVGTGAVPFRPKQVLFICVAVMFLYFCLLQLYNLNEVASANSRVFITADITYMAIVSAVFLVINTVLHDTRYQQFKALKQAEDLRNKSEHQAQELIQLQHQKSRLFANISHEFQTPLTLIYGPIRDALNANPNLPQPVKANLELAERSSNEIHRLVHELIELEKMDAGELTFSPTVFDWVVFIEEIVHFFQPLAVQKEISLYFDDHHSLLPIFADRSMMQKVVQNLVSNAIKFSPTSGQVRLMLDQEIKPDGIVAILEVQDQGVGIRQEDLEVIFDRYYQAEQEKHLGGFGIGLSFARELVQKHGGNLTVESTFGKGSTFRVSIPIQTAQIVASPKITEMRETPFILEAVTEIKTVTTTAHPPLLKQGDIRNATILLVDDQPELRAYLRRMLETDYQVLEAGDGEEAILVLRQHTADLVISDINMPKMDGFGLLKTIRTQPDWLKIPVILLTNRSTEEDMGAGYTLLADEYLAKPFNGDMLLRRVENLIHLRRLLLGTSAPHHEATANRFMTIEDREWLERLRKHISEQMGSSLMGVEWLADMMAMSSRNMGRRVKQLTGLTTNGLVRLMQMERAAELLIQTSKSVVEIAGLVGYQDAKHFSAVFSQVYAKSPSEYRRSNRPA
ncbi:MAG: response regulator [Bacteroidetes Order II. Incertae sedis bacterium]|nr:response regulator [Bacteroidetes Order II. bacterium]